ncbi:MAG: hyperosmotically inducible periplasmic protein [Blastocatellia bacterium]|jgi:hyperosmotically inducible protein|nr:hyperosmotically inducible periplasmic protein [Blastocatellia bacterium]
MKTIKNKMLALVALLAIATGSALAAPVVGNEPATSQDQLMKKVRHELVTLPYYGVWDNLAYKVEGNTVTLYGQVVRPTTRTDAGRRVAKLNGVERVVNNIEVLPLSSFDDALRVRTYRALVRAGGLYRYMMGVNPSIHIIVNRGQVSLEGVVSNKGDSQLAYITARGVSGAFAVVNNLRLDGEAAEAY